MTRAGPKRRFTEDEKHTIREMFAAYEPVKDIAAVLERDEGTVQQFIFHNRLRRSRQASKLLPSAPHLKPVLLSEGEGAFIEAVHAEREESKRQQREAKKQKRAENLDFVDRIVLNADMPRNLKIVAARDAGLTLEEIGTLFGVTRERVRQVLEKPLERLTLPQRYRGGHPPVYATDSERREAQRESYRKSKRRKKFEAQRARYEQAWLQGHDTTTDTTSAA